MGVGAYFLKVFCGGASWAVGLFWGVSKLACSEECAQVAILYVCYKWRICSVWQVAWERMNGCSYDIERTTQSSPLLREGGLRNDAARAALWRTRPYECAIDVCQLLTMVIADWRRELSFHLYWFATNSGFVRFDNVVICVSLSQLSRVVCLPELTWVMPDSDCAMRSCWKSTTWYRAWLSGDKFLSLMFATTGGFVRFDKLLVERLFDLLFGDI